jgi:Cys-rich repeat protein
MLLFAVLSGLAFSCAEGAELDPAGQTTGNQGGGAGSAGEAGNGSSGSGAGDGGASGTSGSGGSGAGAGGTPVGGSGGGGGTEVAGSGGGGAAGTGNDASLDTAGGTGATDAGNDVVTNPCAGVVCNTPPANVCADANNLAVFNPTGTCDQGQCHYTFQATNCPQGCVNDACVNNPCLGVTCITPPASVCADATQLTVYDTPGSCSNGNCSYGSHNVFCGFGCSSGVCNGDPCTGVTCNVPPASYCSAANTLTVHDAPGTCQQQSGLCQYGTHTEFCSFGCAAGACSGNPCAGVSCNTPPASYCVDASTVRTYASSGTCSGGNCSYAHTDSNCPYGCVNGVCQNCQIDANCGSGKWCNNGACADCNDDQHCGVACTNCTSLPGYCSGGTTCVQCLLDSQCGAGNWCNAGTCAPCDVAAHCGPSCVACTGSTPSCVSGTCQCIAGSCPSNQTCVSGSCAVCATDVSCGPTCTPCGGSTPRCLDQGSTSTCVECLTTGDCTGGETCNSNTCGPTCTPPSTACTSGGSQDGGCASPYRITRTAAGSASGFHVNDTYGLCGRDNDFNGGCESGNGSDAEYRLFMRAGESAAITLTRGSSTCTIGWSGTITLRIYKDACSNCASCPSPTCSSGNQVYCVKSNTQNINHVADADGWYTIVVDSVGPVEDKGGVFDLTLKLTCSGTCGC